MEITNNLIKMISSLSMKKNRVENGCFVAEGTKCVRDTWDFFNCRMIIATKQWYERFGTAEHHGKIIIASKPQMERMSQFSTASDVIAVYDIPEYKIDYEELKESLTIILDNVQDPGNLGTIIRIADWYGIKNIVCSSSTVDVFNHKVIQATMGAISRVKVYYCELDEFLDYDWGIPVYGTYLEGENIYNESLSENGFIIFGNEGKGISPKLLDYISNKLFIPSFPVGVATSESLNVGVATAICVSEFRRRSIIK